MHIKTLRTLLAVCVLLALFLSLLPGAMADEGGHRAMGWMKSHEIERIDMVKTVTGQSGDMMSFTVPSMAVKGKEGEVATIKPLTPLSGSYNTSYDMGYISTKGLKSADIALRPYKNATLDVSGGTLVMSMKDIHVLLKDKDYFIFKFHKLGIYLPDGTGKEYKLEKPVHVIYSKDRKMLVIDAYPALSRTLKSEITGGATFPAGTAPVMVSDIAKAEMSGEATWIGAEPHMPSHAPTGTPTAIPTAMPTATPTAMPTATPTAMPTATP